METTQLHIKEKERYNLERNLEDMKKWTFRQKKHMQMNEGMKERKNKKIKDRSKLKKGRKKELIMKWRKKWKKERKKKERKNERKNEERKKESTSKWKKEREKEIASSCVNTLVLSEKDVLCKVTHSGPDINI